MSPLYSQWYWVETGKQRTEVKVIHHVRLSWILLCNIGALCPIIPLQKRPWWEAEELFLKMEKRLTKLVYCIVTWWTFQQQVSSLVLTFKHFKRQSDQITALLFQGTQKLSWRHQLVAMASVLLPPHAAARLIRFPSYERNLIASVNLCASL